jgi:hypothetical protein
MLEARQACSGATGRNGTSFFHPRIPKSEAMDGAEEERGHDMDIRI